MTLLCDLNILEPLNATNESKYELWWQARYQLIKNFYEDGGKNIFSIFKKLDEIESKNVLILESININDNVKLSGRVFLEKRKEPIEYSDYKIDDRLIKLLAYIDNNTKTVVELGCGYGRRIYELSYLLSDIKGINFIGAEYSKSGREIINFLNQSFHVNNEIHTHFTDHKEAEFDFIPKNHGNLIYSCHSLEQVKFLPIDFIHKLATHSKHACTGIHIEPFGFQVSGIDRSTEQIILHDYHRNFAETQDYNLNLWDCIEYALKQGSIELVNIELDFSFIQAENPSSLVAWKST